MWKEITGIFSGPVRRRLSPEDEFFDDGNVQRALLCKISVFVLLEQGRRGEEDTVDVGTEEDNQPVHKCAFPNCSATFSSLKRLEAHFETSHRNRCATCERSFLSHRLLDIHLSEEHDSFFKVMAERKPMYVCLVEGCKETFWSTGKRHVHLVETHRYPKNFDFSRQSFTRTKKDRRVNTKCSPKHPRRKQERHHTEVGVTWSAEMSTVSAMETEGKNPVPGGHRGTIVGGFELAHETNGSRAAAKDGDMDVEDAADERPSMSKCHEDRAAGQNQRLPRRCKYWRTSKGCRAGSECRFRHDAARPPGAEEGELNGAEQQVAVGQEGLGTADGIYGRRNAEHQGDRMDTTDVDELVEGMKKVSIPANLSFGRAARRGELPSTFPPSVGATRLPSPLSAFDDFRPFFLLSLTHSSRHFISAAKASSNPS